MRNAPRTDTAKGWVKGQPLKYAGKGCAFRTEEARQRTIERNRTMPVTKATRRKMRAQRLGKRIPLETRRKMSEAHKGPRSDAPSYTAVHKWLSSYYPKAGRCEECGAVGPTDYASLTGHNYTRDRDDYAELCKLCHAALDNGGIVLVGLRFTGR